MTTTTDQRLYGPPGAESMDSDPCNAAQGEHELGVPTRTEIRTEEAHRRAVSEWMARGV
jgi:hypothetical protein